MDEDGLAGAFRTGDADGVRAVYERYSGAVFTIALRIPGGRQPGLVRPGVLTSHP